MRNGRPPDDIMGMDVTLPVVHYVAQKRKSHDACIVIITEIPIDYPKSPQVKSEFRNILDDRTEGYYGLFGTRRHQPINCGKKRDRSTRSSRSLWKQKRYDSSEIFSTTFSMENVESDGRVEKIGEEVEEEEKIEQFFSLIRRFREAYDSRKRELNEMEERMRRKRKKAEDEQSSWVPTFQPEDFNDEIEFRRPPVISTGGRKENKKVEDLENDGGLNLKLSL